MARKKEEYLITDRDMKEAKLLLEASGEVPSNDSIVEHVHLYLEDRFAGWVKLNWPLWGLFRHWNAYAGKKKVTVAVRSEFEIDDEGHRVRRGAICELCFPFCKECSQQHATGISCQEHAENMSRVARMFGEKSRLIVNPKQIGDL